MKKQLLLGSALLAAISAFPQDGNTKAQPSKRVGLVSHIAVKYAAINNHVVEASPFQAPQQTSNSGHANARVASPIAAVNITNMVTYWNGFTGSENIYGMLVSNSRPLQYNEVLGRVSFVHRKSHTYVPTPAPAPTASTGAIVAEISNSWGQDWDSTCLWNDNINWARYPNGGIYNPSPTTNTNVALAYVIGTGPTTSAGDSWLGNWFASKKLDTLHGAAFQGTVATTAGTVNGTGDMDFISDNPALAGAVGKVDFVRTDFSATKDGSIRALGTIANNVNDATSNSGYGLRGTKIVHATFNNGGFDWSSGANDSIIWPAHIDGNDNYKVLTGEAHMAWSEDGATGYVWQVGALAGGTGVNMGLQPIIYKSTDHGATWTGPHSIDFSVPTMTDVLYHLQPAANSSLSIPWFNASEDMDGIVDMNGNLHIMATLSSHSKAHQDSLFYIWQYPNSVDNETYRYGHVPGARPYVYDFVGDASSSSSWTVITVDSMSSEAPGSITSTDDGYSYNPWDIDPTTSQKVDVSARMQMSRTTDGKYIVYTWAESDTTTTTGQVKWNISPNVKARLLEVSSGTMTVHPNEINITDPLTNADPNVRGYAFNHYISPKCVLSTNSAPGSVAVLLPMTISNNSSLHQLEPVNHYYSTVVLNFDNLTTPIGAPPAPDYKLVTGIAENALNSTQNSMIYPNPAKGNAVLAIDMKDNSKVNVSVVNLVGQEVKSTQTSAQIGQNNINIDLNGLQQGIYMVNVKIGNASSTKKLVVE